MSEEAKPEEGVRSLADLLKQQAAKGETIDDLRDPNAAKEPEAATPEPEPKAEETVAKTEATSAEETPAKEVEEVADDFGFKSDDDTKKPEAKSDEGFDQDAFDAEFPEPEGADEKAANKWQEIKGKLKEAREDALKSKKGVADREALEEEMAELKDKADRLEASEALLEQFKESDYRLKVQNSKEYKEAFSEPVKKIAKQVEQISEDFGLSQEDVANVLSITNRKERSDAINRLMPEENEETGESNARYKQQIAQDLNGMATIYDRALVAQEDMLASAKATSEKQQLARQEQAKADSEVSQKVYRQQLKSVQKEFDSVPLSEANRAKANEAFKSASAMNISTESVDNQAYATAAGAILPSILKENREQAARIAELEGGAAKKAQSSTNLSEGSVSEGTESAEGPRSFKEWAAINAG